MILHRFTCENFRNLEEIDFAPGPGMNVICGPNAQGKTNLLEGLWLFNGGRGFYSAKDREMIRFDKGRAELNLWLNVQGVDAEAKLVLGEKRTSEWDGNPLRHSGLLAEHVRMVVFSPADLSLVQDGPGNRRGFLDDAIRQLVPTYTKMEQEYSRAVGQRNAILRDMKYHPELEELLDAFEQEIAVKGAKIIRYRRRYLERMNESLPEIYKGLSGDRESLTAGYFCVCEWEDLAERLYQSRREDTQNGGTSVGPHRDDVVFLLDGRSARKYGSQGQKRSIALAVRLAEAEVLRATTGEYPVALLDDVMSELDPARQNYVLNHIRGWQVFLTCCDPSNVAGLAEGKMFRMENGRLTPDGERG